ncbi:DNA repair and recombination protein RadA [archaeon]|nr:DNA repair and recombination protein RadA [archaeon]
MTGKRRKTAEEAKEKAPERREPSLRPVPARYMRLEDVPGIGTAIAQKLREYGIASVELLRLSSIADLVSAGVGEQTARRILDAVRGGEFRVMTALQYEKLLGGVRRLTTGCSGLDDILGGGIESMGITEFYGEFNTGKSQICHQLAVTAQLPEDRGGFGEDTRVLYIDTEGSFSPSRIRQIAERFELDPNGVLDNVLFVEVSSVEEQTTFVRRHLDRFITEEGVKLVIVDSVILHFRSEFPGRENLAQRQQKLCQHLLLLQKIARAHNIPVVVTNQVMSKPTGTPPYVGIYNSTDSVGGHVLKHINKYRVFLRKAPRNVRYARLTSAPALPERETMFCITDRGIEDVEKK